MSMLVAKWSTFHLIPETLKAESLGVKTSSTRVARVVFPSSDASVSTSTRHDGGDIKAEACGRSRADNLGDCISMANFWFLAPVYPT